MSDPFSLVEAQLALEDLSIAAGKRRAAEALEKALADGDTNAFARKIVSGAIPLAASEIEARLFLGEDGRGVRAAAAGILRMLDPDLLATVAVIECIQGAIGRGGRQPLAGTLDAIAKDVEAELWAVCLKQQDKGLFDRITKRQLKAHDRRNMRLKGAKAIAAKAGYERERWGVDLKAAVAEPLLDAAMATGLFQLERSAKEETCIALSDEGAALLEDYHGSLLEVARPVHYPMVVPAARWTGFRAGNYLSEAARDRIKMVQSFDRGRNKLISAAMEKGRMAQVQDALETLGATPYAVDLPVLEAVETAYKNGWRANKLPVREVPAYVFPENYGDLSDEEKKGHRIRAGQIRELQQQAQTDAVVMRQTIETARMMASYPAFYQPHYLDFRGRCYPSPTYNHHRADWVRGTIRFAEGQPLGEHGERWLAIHLANNAAGSAYGKLDKLPYDERVTWVWSNQDLIYRVVYHWRENPELILGSDNPFQFLQACREFSALHDHLDEGTPAAEFPSSIAVGLDGTNSGLQHYSAMLRSKEEGRLVNLLPSDKPQDVYGVVAARVLEALHQDETGDGGDAKMARLWLDFGVSRSTVKRQVMTFAYSSGIYGFADQIRKDLMQPLRTEVLLGVRPVHPFGDDGGFEAATYLAKLIWAGVTATVPAAASGLSWIKSVAGLLANHGHPMVWYTPVGMPVLHRYQEWDVKRVSLYLQSGNVKVAKPELRPDATQEEGDTREETDGLTRIRVNMQTRATGVLQKHKQRSASAPNVVHSMDAAHLMLTVNAAAKKGITSLAMIHDSFATHAGRTQDLARILREQFVEMYDGYCPFDEIRAGALKVLPPEAHEDLPEVPAKGDLDLKEVLRSEYFFG